MGRRSAVVEGPNCAPFGTAVFGLFCDLLHKLHHFVCHLRRILSLVPTNHEPSPVGYLRQGYRSLQSSSRKQIRSKPERHAVQRDDPAGNLLLHDRSRIHRNVLQSGPIAGLATGFQQTGDDLQHGHSWNRRHPAPVRDQQLRGGGALQRGDHVLRDGRYADQRLGSFSFSDARKGNGHFADQHDGTVQHVSVFIRRWHADGPELSFDVLRAKRTFVHEFGTDSPLTVT
uniref:(northern house mosquito) hypothetical protein n=2 Tax=Culex pipiens TaxID=7175 RepID=A0A8D8IHF3_CULPI